MMMEMRKPRLMPRTNSSKRPTTMSKIEPTLPKLLLMVELKVN